MKKKLLKILIVVAILVLCLHGVKKIASKFGINILEKSNVETNYDHEWDNISKEDEKIIKKSIFSYISMLSLTLHSTFCGYNPFNDS